MNSKFQKAIVSATEAVLSNPKVKQASKYLSPNEVVKVTRQRRADRREKAITLLLTIGKPNFLGRRFVKAAKKAGEAFPVKKVQVKFLRQGGVKSAAVTRS